MSATFATATAKSRWMRFSATSTNCGLPGSAGQATAISSIIRIHSPVILVEFDHHPGYGFVSDDPYKMHIHTMVRTPNGNDYGKALLKTFKKGR